MSEGIGATQALQPNPDSVQQISKRKPDSPPLDGSDDTRRASKIPRLDQDQNARPCHDPSAENGEKEKVVDKGKTKEEEKEPDQNLDHNTDVSVDKGKGKVIVQEPDQNRNPSSKAFVDKGKGKMIMVEEEEDSSDDSDVAGVASGSDSDYSDDPLMEVDLNNILPSRTRRWAPPVPGAYLVPPDQDDDEDDDDDDASDDGVTVDDDDSESE